MDIWVQLHDMNAGFMSQRVMKDVGNYIGTFVESDSNNFTGVWREYLRVRVSISLDIPLKRRMKLRKNADQWSWVNFKYEGIPTFYFICGFIGHSDKFCEKLFETPENLITRPFGQWMRAEPRRRNYAIGSKWLRPVGGFPVASSGEREDPITGKVVTENIGITDQLGAKQGQLMDISNEDKEEVDGVNQGSRLSNNNVIISQDFITQQPNANLEIANAEVDGAELICSDPKRRRVNENNENNALTTWDNSGQVADSSMDIAEGSKNGEMAGAVLQPRLAL